MYGTFCYHLLGDGSEVPAVTDTLLLPPGQDLPPPPLHWPEHGHVQRLQEVGGVFREESEPDIMLFAQLDNDGGEVGGKVITQQNLDLFLGDVLVDVGNEDL